MKIKWSPFPWLCLAMCVGVMGTALISPLYALYKEAWNLQTSDISAIYVVYMAGALSGLLFLGRLTDRIGFLKVMQLALALALVGTFFSMTARDILALCMARFLVGVSSSLMVTSASIGLTLVSKQGGAQRAAVVTSFLLTVGFGIGPLMGGILGEWAPWPLITTYVPTLLLGILGLYALRRLALSRALAGDRHKTVSRPARWTQWLPQLKWADPVDSMAFLVTCICPFIAFGVFGLFASISPLFLEKMVTWHGPFVSGSAIAVILLLSGSVQLTAGNLPTRWSGLWGLLALALCSGMLVANLWLGSTLLFCLSVVMTAAGHGLTMVAGMRMVSRLAQPHTRAGLLSTYLVIGYLGSMVPVLGMGWIADHWGLEAAVTIFCCSVIVLATATAPCFFRHPRMGDA